jgi:RHS repeat-associated protein
MSATGVSVGNRQALTDPLQRSVGFAYDTAGRVTTQTLPDSRVINFTYDANGNVASITPPGRSAHAFAYTPVDLESQYTPPNVQPPLSTPQTTYTYNLDRQLTTITRPDGQIVGLGYDTAGRLSTQTLPGNRSVTYAYNSTTGTLATVSGPDGIGLAFAYDGRLPLSETWSGPLAGSVSRTYDNNFRVVSESVNGANSIGLTYDTDSLLTGAGSLTLSRSAQNGLISATTLGSVTDTRGYSGFGEVSSYSAASNGSPVYTAQYTRDALGRISGKDETIGGVTDTVTYTYDTAGRLSDVVKNGAALAHYDYDANSNRSGGFNQRCSAIGNAIIDAQDRLSTIDCGPSTASYTYTGNGELATKAAGAQTTTYSYDALGNLTAVTLPGGTQVDYVIDGRNRRIGKKVNGALVQGFLYRNHLSPVAELDGAGTIVARFVYATKPNVPDYMIKGGMTYRLITDHLGSPRLVVNVADGTVAQRMDYDEFGNVLLDTNPGFQPFGFAGGVYDSATKLVRFGARDYDPETGRWTAKDPIRFEGGDPNLYGYVLSDPMNSADPAGLQLFPAPVPDGTLDWGIDPGQAGGAAKDFIDNYNDMRNANTIGADQYFHCKANCEAAQRGVAGENTANMISEAREQVDEHIKGDSPAACNADRRANEQGREGRNRKRSCASVCASLRPLALGPQY